MREMILALAIPLAMLIASPALAIKVAPRDETPQKEQASHQADRASKPADSGMAQPHEPAARPNGDGPKVDRPSIKKDSPRDRRPGPPPEPSRADHGQRRDIRGNDNFIDQNHDGIDDRLQKPPEVIKKKDPKQEHAPAQNPQRNSERQRQSQRQSTRERSGRSR